MEEIAFVEELNLNPQASERTDPVGMQVNDEGVIEWAGQMKDIEPKVGSSVNIDH